MSERTTQWWFLPFKRGKFDLKEKERVVNKSGESSLIQCY